MINLISQWKCHYWTFQAFQKTKTLPTIVTNSSLVISTHLGILISTITLNIIRSKVSCLITPRSCDTTIFIRFFELIYYLLSSTALLLLTNQNMCCIFSSEFQFSYFLKSVIKPFLNCYIYIDKASRTNCFIIRRYSQKASSPDLLFRLAVLSLHGK